MQARPLHVRAGHWGVGNQCVKALALALMSRGPQVKLQPAGEGLRLGVQVTTHAELRGSQPEGQQACAIGGHAAGKQRADD